MTFTTEVERRQAIHRVRRKRAFWAQVSWYTVLNLAFWLSWIIGGLRDEWVLPWPLIPTVLWGLFILYREHQLGGWRSISHETIEHEIEELRQPVGPIYQDHVIKRDIPYGDSAAYRPIRPFHLQDVIDARERKADSDAAYGAVDAAAGAGDTPA